MINKLATTAAAILVSSTLACDLVPVQWNVENSWLIDEVVAESDACLLHESCLTGPGVRTVLRFASHLENRGTTDCQVGFTPSCPSDLDAPAPDVPPYYYDTCHKHWHVSGFSNYDLWSLETNERVAHGQKNGLCLMDVICPTGKKKKTCYDQGISAGCIDIYDNRLDCQWIDITDIPDLQGRYRFTWETNPNGVIKETNYDNNKVDVVVDLSKVQRVKVTPSYAPNECPATVSRVIYTTTTTKPCSRFSLRRECRELRN